MTKRRVANIWLLQEKKNVLLLFFLDILLNTMNPATISYSFTQGLNQIIRGLDAAHSVLITSHINGDGDSIGSSLGLYHALRSSGKTVTVVHPSAVPYNLLFLPGASEIQVFDPQQHTTLFHSVEALVVLDANAPSRMTDMEALIRNSTMTKYVIDHHQDPQNFADVYAIDTESCSTAELVYRLITVWGKPPMSQAIAECLYTGIMTDTGNFRFPRTTAEIHRIIAALMDAGADAPTLYEQVFHQNPYNRALLLGMALSGLQLFHNARMCMMTVSRAMIEQTGATEDLIEGFVDHTLGIQGVQMGILVVELADMVKISLRSKGSLAVNQIARHFGGGGHINAAGCRTKHHSFQEVQNLLVQLSAQYL